uniref:MULE transposase domain-containing protein n=1 Tax=Lactuca sativa TaxID=4236 RepID=A0A9R1X7B3_LACSA|nr:hypothetical protein LSAT_V11C600338250 [Lactuca sativa]
MGRDANNNMFSLAWAVVTVENKETWKWFLDLLIHDIDKGNRNELTLISDGHKGLIEAIKERVPHAEHRLCARHILANFNSKFKGEHFIKPFWRVVKATTKQRHEAAMQEIKELDRGAFDYLMKRDPKCYCRAFQEGVFCDVVENGISESFNAEIVEAGHKPIIAILEDIRVYVILWDVYPCGYQQFQVVLCNNSSLWTQSEYTKPLPLKSRRLHGRPSTKRRKSATEKEISSTHSIKSKASAKVFNMLCNPGSSTPAPIPTPGSTSATPRSTPATPRPRSTSARLVQSAIQLRKRKASERITKLFVRKKVVLKDGSGCSSEKPVDLT